VADVPQDVLHQQLVAVLQRCGLAETRGPVVSEALGQSLNRSDEILPVHCVAVFEVGGESLGLQEGEGSEAPNDCLVEFLSFEPALALLVEDNKVFCYLVLVNYWKKIGELREIGEGLSYWKILFRMVVVAQYSPAILIPGVWANFMAKV